MANLSSVSLETSSELKFEEWQKTSIAFHSGGVSDLWRARLRNGEPQFPCSVFR
ncbi:hypothetical protein [Methanosarcina spelaei]|uniref:hypothetical protein n=1 Tax=Methanosarcina spelaei TaxID=1036679 RepID=UPI0014821893|nr:hypothetical protein [Methanosarcina spelaei]